MLSVLSRLVTVALVASAVVAAPGSGFAQGQPERRFTMDVSAVILVGDERLHIERAVECRLFLLPTIRPGGTGRRGKWDRSIQVVGDRLRSGRGVGIAVPDVCGFVSGFEERIRSGQLPPDYPGVPAEFSPAVVLVDDIERFSTITVVLDRESMRQHSPPIRVLELAARKASQRKPLGPTDPFSWLQFTPAGTRSFVRDVRPSARYFGWQVVRLEQKLWAGYEPMEQFIEAHHASQLVPFNPALRYEQWPNKNPKLMPPEIGIVLGGQSLPPCTGLPSLAFLCQHTNGYQNLIPLERTGSGYRPVPAMRGMAILYRFDHPPGARPPWFPRAELASEFIFELDGIHPSLGQFTRQFFLRPSVPELLEIQLIGLFVYDPPER